ncbi:MAG: RidA family protein [Lachnospiraceae bacterium]|nr:RidA family protein [Lachnospiraceae bacterium]
MGKPSRIGARCYVENGVITRTQVCGSATIVPTPPEIRLKELGITIPPANKPIANYVPGVKSGHLIFTSGQTPKASNNLQYTGKIGKDLTVEEGKEAARLCALSCLAIIRDLAGSLDKVKRVVKITGYVNSTPDFTGQPQVVNGASDLVKEIFGEAGAHARAAVGVAALPVNAACEIEMIVEVKD